MNGEPLSAGSASASKPNTESSVRLLLHAVDGVIPYLTPNLCRRCFPSESVGDVLSICIAVRDTCLVPVFEDETKPHRKAASRAKDQGAPKPRKYIFSSSVKPYPYLLTYNRVTVPTFDLYQDAALFDKNKKDPLGVAAMVLPLATTHVHMWTANGRHQITPKEYAACADSLGSAVTVPLFDMLPPCGTGSTGIEDEDILLQKRRMKRILAVSQRNQQWTEVIQEGSHHGRFLTPVAVGVDADPCPEAVQWITEEFSRKSGIGIVLVGWQHITEAARRWNVLQALPSSMPLASLSTTTTLQLVELLRISHINKIEVMIGTGLPTKWAQSKKAFLCDLMTRENLDSSSVEHETKRRTRRH